MELLYVTVTFTLLFLVEGRVYSPKKTKKDVVIVPDKGIPICNMPCTLQFIPPECRQETFEFQHGRRCKGCDRDICINNFPARGDLNNQWQDNSWQNGVFIGQDTGFLGQNIGSNGFVDRRRIGGNTEFIDNFQNGIFNSQRGQLSGNRFNSNRQFGNGWQ